MTKVKIIADSIAPHGERITTMQIKFHRFVLAEFNTHRMFSRNFSSSRAIPTKKLLEQVRTAPAMPVWWGKNQAGMQANEELVGVEKEIVKEQWLEMARRAADQAEEMASSNAHKQIVNRIIEPFLYVQGIVTSTEWDNFFSLRCHPDAQPEIQALAYKMRDALADNEPKHTKYGEWHLPYIYEDEKETLPPADLQKISAARCCRVSYLKHDGERATAQEELDLFYKLAGAVPIHASPLEHQAKCTAYTAASRNFLGGWVQFREIWEQSLAK